MPLALSTGHQIGLAVTSAVFIVFALGSSMLLPRFRPQYPGGGLPAFIVVAFVFFFGMLTAVEVFGAEEKEGGEHVAETTAEPTATTTQPTTTQQATTAQATTTTAPKPQATTVKVTETEFKIALASTNLKAGKITFDVKNDGKIQHDLAIKGMSEKTKLISAGGSAQLTVTLKPGTYDLYCSVAGHEQAGMDLKVTVT
ncbi:MAG TPA: cupredoxin domain-containing protein [Gaiellaceae bacterium]